MEQLLLEILSKLDAIEDRLLDLEQENINTTNELYRIENRIDMIVGECSLETNQYHFPNT